MSGLDHFIHMIYPFAFLPSNNTRDPKQIDTENQLIKNGITNDEFNFTIRPLSVDDRAILRHFYEKPIDLGDYSYPYEGKYVFDDHNPATKYAYNLFSTALRLLKRGDVYLTHTFRKDPYSFSLSIAPIPRFPQYILHYNELDDVLTLMRRIQRIINIQNDYRKTAIYFFNSSYTRLFGNKLTQRLIDLMISAEALFTHEKQYGQKKYALAQTASLLLGKNDDERNKIKDLFFKAYTIRNNYVHGSDIREIMRQIINTFGDLENYVNEIEENIRNAIKIVI